MPDLKLMLNMYNLDLNSKIDVYKFQENLKTTIDHFVDVYFQAKNLPRLISLDDLVDHLGLFLIDKYIITTESQQCIINSIVNESEEVIKCKSWKALTTDPLIGIRQMIKKQHTFNEKLSDRLTSAINKEETYKQLLPDLLSLLPPMGLTEKELNNNFKSFKIPKVQFTTKMALMRINSKWISNGEGKLTRHITHITMMSKVDEIEFYRVGDDFQFLETYNIPLRANFDYIDYRLSKSVEDTIEWLRSLPLFNYKDWITKRIFIAWSTNEVADLSCYSPDIANFMQQLDYKFNKQYSVNNITGLGLEMIGLTVTKNEVIQQQQKTQRKKNDERAKKGELLQEY